MTKEAESGSSVHLPHAALGPSIDAFGASVVVGRRAERHPLDTVVEVLDAALQLRAVGRRGGGVRVRRGQRVDTPREGKSLPRSKAHVLALAQQDATWNRRQIADQLRAPCCARTTRPRSRLSPIGRGFHRLEERPGPTPSPRSPTRRAHPRESRSSDPRADPGRTRTRGPTASDRDPSRTVARRLPRRVGTSAAAGRRGFRQALARRARATPRGLHGRRRPGRGGGGGVPPTPGCRSHPEFPGLGTRLRARGLAEIGDDRARLPTPAGSSPTPVLHPSSVRPARSPVSPDVGSRTTASTTPATSGHSRPCTRHPVPRAHHRRRTDHGDWHAAAQRKLCNRMLGQLHHCLQQHGPFDEQIAFPTEIPAAA